MYTKICQSIWLILSELFTKMNKSNEQNRNLKSTPIWTQTNVPGSFMCVCVTGSLFCRFECLIFVVKFAQYKSSRLANHCIKSRTCFFYRYFVIFARKIHLETYFFEHCDKDLPIEMTYTERIFYKNESIEWTGFFGAAEGGDVLGSPKTNTA